LSTQRAHLTQSSHSFTSRIELVAATLVGLSSMAGCNMFLELSGATTRYNETRAALFKTRADASKVDEDEVDADVMITHREASMELNTSRKMSDLSLSSSSLVSDESERKEEESEQASAVQEEKLLEVLLPLQAEAEFLLRQPLSSAAALQQARDRVTSALTFERMLTQLAADQKVLKGKIFQSLLAGLLLSGAAHQGGIELSARGEEGQPRSSAEADRGGGSAEAAALGLGRTEWVAMQASADSMRGLVRIKIADDNDIKAARCALETCRDFFDSLEQLAALRRGTAFDTMQSLL